MTRKLLGLVLGVGVLVSAAPVVAHHSVSAEFDTTKTITFTGKVKEVNWGNPHIYTSVEAHRSRHREGRRFSGGRRRLRTRCSARAGARTR